MTGDFNDIVGNQEKWGGRLRREGSFREFGDFIHSNGLIDLGFEGVPWTWGMKRGDGTDVKERLDRALCSDQWFFEFPKAKNKHITTVASDHCLLLLDSDQIPIHSKRRFHFDQKWLHFNDVSAVVTEAWRREQWGSPAFRLVSKLRECKKELIGWNKKINVNASKEIKR